VIDGEENPREVAVAAFGRWLLQERELRGLGRDEVGRLTKLGPGLIEALESGEAQRMPPKAYVCGYLRAYAGAVGLDADDVVLRWQEVVGPEDDRRTPARRAAPVKALVAAAVALAVALFLALVLFGRPERQRTPLKLDRPRAVERGAYPTAPPGR
jgi:cytoskeletal protein RodZ